MTTNSGVTKGNMYPEMDYFMNESESDITFVVDGKPIPSNKTFLSYKSEVFRAQFSGNFVDSSKKEVVVEDTTYEAFVEMLRFLHKEVLELSDPSDIELAKEVYKLADKYRLLRLMAEMDKHFKRLITWDNINEIITFASDRDLKSLMKVGIDLFANDINNWVDKDMNELFELNTKTNNSLFALIMAKFKETKERITQLKHTNTCVNCGKRDHVPIKDSETSDVVGTWKYEQSLCDAVSWNFNKVDM